MKRKIQSPVSIVLGVLMIITVLAGYIPEPEYIVELTCLSNFGAGAMLIFAGIRQWKGRKGLPLPFYRSGLTAILLVFLICMGSLGGMYHMNFKGAFFFLHVINPLLFLLYYIIFIREEKGRLWITPLPTLVYLALDYGIGTLAGKFVYGFFEPGELAVWEAAVIGMVFYLLLFLLAAVMFGVNRLLHKKKSGQ